MMKNQRGFIINPFVHGGGGGPDLYFANVVSLVQFYGGASGVNASPYADVIANRSPGWTDIGFQTIYSNSIVLYDTSPIPSSINSGSVGLWNADHADWDFGSGDFTVECWVKYGTLADFGALFCQWIPGGYAPFLVLSSAAGAVTFASTTNASSWDWIQASSAGVVSTTGWYHVAMCRSGTTVRGFVNGTEVVSSGTLSGSLVTPSVNVTLCRDGGSTNAVNCFIDSFRATKGVARYTSNFTPPTTAFPTS